MSRDSELLPQEELPPDLEVQYIDHTDPFLVVCRCFSVLTAVSAILCVAVNVYSAVHSFSSGQDVFSGILRCYAVVIALFVAVAETEWQRIFQFWKFHESKEWEGFKQQAAAHQAPADILEYWAGRGMLQVFVAVMTRALADQESGGTAIVIAQQVSSYMLLACGVIYIVTGLLCFGHLKRSRLQKALSREQAARDLEELERRRKELQSLLGKRSRS